MALMKEDSPQEPREQMADSPERALYVQLIRTATRLEAELNRVFRPMQLTGATYNILRILESAGSNGRSCGDISEQLIAEVPDMTRLLDRLERLGYVARARSSVDRRMVTVTITENGRAVLSQLREVVGACHKRQFGALGEAGMAQLSQGLSVILERLEHLERPQDAGGRGMPKHPPH
jgi:DNA-binding MarR family transcriptional regulator